MAPARCDPIWPLCIHEIHALVVGLLVGVLVALLLRRATRYGAVLLIAAVVLAWLAPVHGILKPWYVLGGTAVVLVAARAARLVSDG